MKLSKKFEVPMYHTSVIVLVGTSTELTEYIEEGSFYSSSSSKLASNATYDEIESYKKGLVERITDLEKGPNAFCSKVKGTNRHFIIAVNLSKDVYHRDYKKGICIAVPHEVRHYVDHIMTKCGIKDTEAAAYMTGWLCGEIIPALL